MQLHQRIVILGLSLTSSWRNGHAGAYRALVAALAARGHDVLFLERDVPAHAANRDLPAPPWGRTALYDSLEALRDQHGCAIRDADVVLVGSSVPDGIAVGRFVLETARGIRAFYDIDTPVTLHALAQGRCPYLAKDLVPRYDLYLSFAGGPTLALLERTWGAPLARQLYGAADPDTFFPEDVSREFALGYLGTYSEDRQPGLEALLLAPARHLPQRRFAVAGPPFPDHVRWPENVERIERVRPDEHRRFHNRQLCSLSLARADLRERGHAPSLRLFEAAACGVPVMTDVWPGLEELFTPGAEILPVRSASDSLRILRALREEDRDAIGRAARRRVLAQHTPQHRAAELDDAVALARERRARRRGGPVRLAGGTLAERRRARAASETHAL